MAATSVPGERAGAVRSGAVPPSAARLRSGRARLRAGPSAPTAYAARDGDSLAQPLDTELARRLAVEDGVRVVRDPHVGTGVSKSGFVDWGRLSTQHVRKEATEPYRAQLRVLDRIRRDFGP